MTASDPQHAKISRGTPLDAARESMLLTPAWLPFAVAVLSVLVLDVAVPRNTTGGLAAISTVLGLAIGVGSIGFLIYRRQTKAHMRTLIRSLTSLDAVSKMSSNEVHDLVLAALLRRGWHVEEGLPGGAPDGVMIMTAERIRRAVFFLGTHETVGAETVRVLEAQVRGRARSLFVTPSSFAPEAIVFARQIGVELVDGAGVLTLMTELRGEAKALGPLPSPTFVWEDEVLAGHPLRSTPTAAVATSTERRCPECGSAMKAHANSTTRYWACSRFPDCSGMIIIT